MDHLFEIIETNPLITILLILLIVMVLWAILNRLIKAAVILFIGIIIYAGYMQYSGKPLPHDSKTIIQQGKEQVDSLKDYGFKLIKDMVINSLSEKEISLSEKNKPISDPSKINPHQHTP